MISLIVARSKNYVIGQGNKIPWSVSEDIRLFKKKTMGHPIIMGSKTYYSLNMKNGLPGRTNIVLTKGDGYFFFCKKAYSLRHAFSIAKLHEGSEEIFIIGGQSIYNLALEQDVVDRIYLSEINMTCNGDKYFRWIPTENWKLIKQEKYNDFSFYAYNKQ